MSLTSNLKKAGKRAGPVWQGPEDAGPQGGVTQSLLGRFLGCRERFRLLVVEGLKAHEGFNHRLEYGNMWHVCEETLAKRVSDGKADPEDATSDSDWVFAVASYCRKLMLQYPMDREQINKWYNCCLSQFPIYVQHWSRHPDVVDRTPLLQEEAFNVPYELPSGRIVRLRGKFDAVDLIGKGKTAGIWLQENKTKGEVDEAQLKNQLSFDLQTLFYMIALHRHVIKHVDEIPALADCAAGRVDLSIKGVRYNVIRRPLSGGKGNIKMLENVNRGKKAAPRAESEEEYYGRLQQYFIDEPDYWFIRFKAEVSPADVTRFRRECLDPILEGLCQWWDAVSFAATQKNKDPFGEPQTGLHYRMPFGVYSPLSEGKPTEMDAYLNEGSLAGLTRTQNLFPELQEGD